MEECPYCGEVNENVVINAFLGKKKEKPECMNCQDYETQFRLIMEEKCPSEEKHCTCVPLLRKKIKQLEEKEEGYALFLGSADKDVKRFSKALDKAIGDYIKWRDKSNRMSEQIEELEKKYRYSGYIDGDGVADKLKEIREADKTGNHSQD